MKGLRAEFEQRSVRFALEHLKFIDETGMNLALTRLYGRAAPGVRVVDSVPHDYGEHLTLLAALGVDGLSAPMTVDGAVDTEVCRSYVEQVLGPTVVAGDIVMLDNLAVHKVDAIAEAIRARGAGLEFLPPYSPDLNPIEPMWSKVKNTLRSLEARTRESLVEAIGQALAGITPQDTRNWFAHCGYNFI